MNRTGLVLVSLLIAIPGAFLTVLMVMNFLQRASDLSGMLLVLSGLTLLVSALVALAPVGILVFIPKSKTADEKEDSEETGTESEELSAIVEQAEDFEEDLDAEEVDEFEPESDDAETEVLEAQDQGDEDFFMEEDEDIEFGGDDKRR